MNYVQFNFVQVTPFHNFNSTIPSPGCVTYQERQKHEFMTQYFIKNVLGLYQRLAFRFSFLQEDFIIILYKKGVPYSGNF